MRLSIAIGVAFVAMLLCVGFWLYTPDRSRASLEAKYLKPADQYLEIAGVRLRVRDTGPKTAPAVLMLHGFGDSLETWESWATVLSTDHRVVRFDLPGFALTGPDPSGDYSDRRSLAVITALMDRLGIARASLIGNSLGGKLAWELAALEPDRVDRLVLVSPDGFASPGFAYGKKADVPFMLRLLPYTLPEFLVRSSMAPAFANPASMSDALVTRYRDMMLAPGARAAMLARMAQVMLEDPEPLLRRIKAPTLLIWGREDGMIPVANAADYQRDLPDSRLVELPGLGHLPQEEAPEISIAAVRDFLKS